MDGLELSVSMIEPAGKLTTALQLLSTVVAT